MDLIGKKVVHTKYGIGIIVAADEKSVNVRFDGRDNTSSFKFPSSFGKYLRFENENDQSKVKDEIEKSNEKEKTFNQEIERSIIVPTIDKTDRHDVPIIINTGGPSVYLVFQGTSFDKESEGGYIWAPIKNAAGRTFHHWERLTNVRQGDVLFHCAGGYIKAISCAKGSCYNSDRPKLFDDWIKDGRKVDLDYFVLGNPIPHGKYKTEILKYYRTPYFPFNKKGNGVQGYLFELPKGLAQYFLQEATKVNPELEKEKYLGFLY